MARKTAGTGGETFVGKDASVVVVVDDKILGIIKQ